MAKDPKQKSLGSIFISGILTENPVLRLILVLAQHWLFPQAPLTLWAWALPPPLFLFVLTQ